MLLGLWFSLILLSEGVEGFSQVRLLSISQWGIVTMGLLVSLLWGKSLRPTKTKSIPEPGTAVVSSLLSVHPPTLVSLCESGESQVQWGRSMLPLSTVVGGSPDDSPLASGIGLIWCQRDSHSILGKSGSTCVLLSIARLASGSAMPEFTSVGWRDVRYLGSLLFSGSQAFLKNHLSEFSLGCFLFYVQEWAVLVLSRGNKEKQVYAILSKPEISLAF